MIEGEFEQRRPQPRRHACEGLAGEPDDPFNSIGRERPGRHVFRKRALRAGPLHRATGRDRALRLPVLPGPTRRLRTRGPLFLPPEPWRRRSPTVQGSMIPRPPRYLSPAVPPSVAGSSLSLARASDSFPDGGRPLCTLIPRCLVRHDRSRYGSPRKTRAARDPALGRRESHPQF